MSEKSRTKKRCKPEPSKRPAPPQTKPADSTQCPQQPPLFPQIPPFPEEGIVGMYPIQSACEKDVADHMVRFQRKLWEEMTTPRFHVKMSDFRNPLEQSLDKVAEEMERLEAGIEELKHKLAVEAIKKKYREHDVDCPCASEDS